ncbi:MAG: hypothetical protein ACYTGV_09195 [Planctomycetota bacterium]
MWTKVELPRDLLEAAEVAALRFGLTPSEFVHEAIAGWLARHGGRGMIRQLDEIHEADHPSLDPALAAMQFGSLPREEW